MTLTICKSQCRRDKKNKTWKICESLWTSVFDHEAVNLSDSGKTWASTLTEKKDQSWHIPEANRYSHLQITIFYF